MRLSLISLLTLAPLATGAPAPRCAEGVTLGARAEATSPNYCVALSPTPDLDSVSATLELQPAAVPFGVAVTRDGLPRYLISIDIAGLPEASTLGPYRAFVAWAYTLAMDSAVKLGEVRNGRAELGELARDQFRVIITAESSAAVVERGGRIVLRGTSPASRTLAHRDFTTSFNPGVLSGGVMAGMDGGSIAPETGIGPGGDADASTIPLARAPRSIELHDGDTLALTAAPARVTIDGRAIVVYAYNGQFPGPTLYVRRGSTIIVRFRNRIDLPTAVHWHGVRVENRFDGAVGVTQPAVAPGADFVYRVRFRDAGVFWYHAHDREDIQVASGLFGNIIVDPIPFSRNWGVPRPQVLTLSDLTIDASGLVPYGRSSPTHALMGRYGTRLLVNGKQTFTAQARLHEYQILYVTNASSARVYNLSFSNAQMLVLRSDLGAFDLPRSAKSLVIAPAERYVIAVRFDSVGTSVLTNRVQALDHASGTIYPEIDTLGAVLVEGHDSKTVTDYVGPKPQVDSTSVLLTYVDSTPAHVLTLAMRVHGLPAATMNMLNGVSLPVDWNDGLGVMNRDATGKEVDWVLRDAATGRENMDIDWHFRVGTFAKIRVYNDPNGAHPMDHPMHVHGQRMLLLARNGVANADPVWKDTILIPAGEIDDLLIEMSNPGAWMMHCHIAEHRTAGMMMAFHVDSM